MFFQCSKLPKKPAFKWTYEVQTHVVQRSTVYSYDGMLLSNRKHYQYTYNSYRHHTEAMYKITCDLFYMTFENRSNHHVLWGYKSKQWLFLRGGGWLAGAMRELSVEMDIFIFLTGSWFHGYIRLSKNHQIRHLGVCFTACQFFFKWKRIACIVCLNKLKWKRNLYIEFKNG